MANKKKADHEESGRLLLDQLVQATGLESAAVERELHRLLQKRGVDPEKVTLPELREAAAAYLREVMTELLDRMETDRPPGA